MAPEVVQRELALAPAVAQRFECHVQADLVAEPEAVDDGPGGVEDRHLDAVDVQAIDALGQGSVGHAHDTDRGLVQPGGHHVRRDRDPDLEGGLRADLVDAQRGQQADHALGHACRDFRQRAVLADLGAGQAVEAARHAFELAGLHQARQGDRRQALLRQVARAQQRSRACEAQHLLFVGGGGCCDGRLHAYIVLWKTVKVNAYSANATSVLAPWFFPNCARPPTCKGQRTRELRPGTVGVHAASATGR